ncbi:MAG: hypothetical protein FJ161_00170 [Gammaproteobacteria bacterium]|nr:hypothetical protein [Gammaproteobacteria bacterium]
MMNNTDFHKMREELCRLAYVIIEPDIELHSHWKCIPQQQLESFLSKSIQYPEKMQQSMSRFVLIWHDSGVLYDLLISLSEDEKKLLPYQEIFCHHEDRATVIVFYHFILSAIGDFIDPLACFMVINNHCYLDFHHKAMLWIGASLTKDTQ